MDISAILTKQEAFFYNGNTQNINDRVKKLKQLMACIEKHEEEVLQALNLDFRKSAYEGYMTELSMVYLELKDFIKNTSKWAKPKRVLQSIINFPATEYLQAQPFGKVLIIAPWNYPFMLAIQPLIAAIAAGNVIILKPSELTPNTASVIKKIIEEVFEPDWVKVIEGDVEVTTKILEQRFAKIFFTGSTAVGKIVHQAAAKHLTPVVLELGGKSPCVITASANLEVAVKRIVFGKFVNGGQTCIAPDFIWIDEKIKDKFLKLLKSRIIECYGEDIENNPDFPRIINAKNFNRLKSYLTNGTVYFGGQTNADTNYIAPTVLDEVRFKDEVMQDEIFGPILPVLTFSTLQEVVKHNHETEKPLAFYIFSTNKKEIDYLQKNMQFGGGCVNDVLSHIINKRVPFGGFGNSGMGNYHGKFGFSAFTHTRGFVIRKNWLDIPIKYAPYSNKMPILRKFFALLKV